MASHGFLAERARRWRFSSSWSRASSSISASAAPCSCLPVIALGSYASVPWRQCCRDSVAKIAENATDYSLQNTVRRALFLPTTPRGEVQGAAGGRDILLARRRHALGGDRLPRHAVASIRFGGSPSSISSSSSVWLGDRRHSWHGENSPADGQGRARRRMIAVACLIASPASVLFVCPARCTGAGTGTTRAEELRREREEKARNLSPPEPSRLEQDAARSRKRPPVRTAAESGRRPLSEDRERHRRKRHLVWSRVPEDRTSSAGMWTSARSPLASFKQYWMVDARLQLPRLANETVAVDAHVQTLRFPEEDFFGLGPDSARGSRHLRLAQLRRRRHGGHSSR